MQEVLEIGLENEYGGVELYKKDGKYFIALGGIGGKDSKEISMPLYVAIKTELCADSIKNTQIKGSEEDEIR